MAKKQSKTKGEVLNPRAKEKAYSFPEYGVTIMATDTQDAERKLHAKLKQDD